MDIYRIRKFNLVLLTGVCISFFSFLLHSCSVVNNKLGVNYIQDQNLQQCRRKYQTGVLPIEFKNNVERLTMEGFVGPNAQNDNINVRKHLMFVFYHCLRIKQQANGNNANMINNIFQFFGDGIINPNPNAIGLMFNPRPVQGNDGQPAIRFMFTHLLNQNDPRGAANTRLVNGSTAPFVRIDNQLSLVLNGNAVVNQWVDSKVEVDHLLRDNRITIELPRPVHELKTRYLDKLLSPTGAGIIRRPALHWGTRVPI